MTNGLRKIRGTATVVLLLLCIPSVALAARQVTVAILSDGPWATTQAVRKQIIQESTALTEGEFLVRFPKDKQRVGDWSRDTARQQLTEALADPEVDLVISLGLISSVEAANRPNLPKPVIAPITVDREVQRFPYRNGVSGKTNFTYIAAPSATRRDLKAFYELMPFRHLALLVNRSYLEALSGVDIVKQMARETGFRLTVIPVSGNPGKALEAIPANADAVYVTPLPQMTEQGFSFLVEGLKQRRLPSFSLLGRPEVTKGLMATVAQQTKLQQLARRTALNIQRILLGEKASELPVPIDQTEQLVINMKTARAVGFYPQWKFLTDAELLNQEKPVPERVLTLSQVVQQAMSGNLDLIQQTRVVSAGEQQVRSSRSELFPQVSFGLSAQKIDGDRASAQQGLNPETALRGTLSLSQPVLSESRRASYDIEKYSQNARVHALKQTRLDVVEEVAVAYLDVLRAKTLQRIQRDNLKLTRTNLRLAEVREQVGFSGPSEVFRWQSQIATDRQNLIQADVQRELAQINLNRILNMPAEAPFETTEVGLDDPSLFTSDKRFTRYIDNPFSFDLLRRFVVTDSLQRSPEAKRLQENIAAQERLLKASKRVFYMPEISLDASATRLLGDGGDGENTASSPADETDYTIGLNLSLPLYTSGRLTSEVRRVHEELAGLRAQQSAVRNQIEQRVRNAMHTARGSFAAIDLSRDAADAAHRSLKLVRDSYSNGTVSIIELIDAQNAALIADQQAANAVYDFLADLMEVERASGSFNFFAKPSDRESWYLRLDNYFARNGISLREVN